MIRTTVATALITAGPLVPQDEAARIPAVLDFERDRGLVLGVVDGHPVRLGELATYVRKYDPAVLERWRRPRDLNSAALPQYLYQYADILCLRAEAKQRELDLASLGDLIEKKIAKSFRVYLAAVERQRRGKKLTPKGIAFYQRRHRQAHGLRAEVAALLELIVPGRYKRTELRLWHTEHGDVFGGQVKFAHILLELRDPRTGRLKPLPERHRLRALAWDLSKRLQKDPGLFAELAHRHSNDRTTAARGGEFRAWTNRLNERLPAILVKTAWELRDGRVSQPVESYYGIHLVRRLKQVVNRYILFYGKTIDRIATMKAKFDREDFLFGMRKRHKIELRL